MQGPDIMPCRALRAAAARVRQARRVAEPAPDLAALRRDYRRAGLSEGDLAPTWTEQFRRWFAEARGLLEPNAAVLATADPAAGPSARTVLVKAVDERGFTVFTNLTSRKARDVAADARASLVFPWLELERQVVVVGGVERVADAETEAYFRSRPRGSQIAAWTSRQSSVLPDRAVLERRREQLEQRFGDGEVPVPPFWGGLRVVPRSVEFWQGRPSRLHDRLRYRRAGSGATPAGWVVERLAP